MTKREEIRALTLKQVVARNVQALLDREDKMRRGQLSRFVKLHAGVRISKIQRAVKDGAIGLDTIEQLAKIFRVEPYQMLIKGLNVDEPQVAIERRYVTAAKQMARELAEAG